MMRLWAVVALILCVGAADIARADEDAKSVFERGTALFALHKFGEAALVFEKAFELRPDPAILYNAAQAHRLAGNNARALELYESLLRLYGDKFKRTEITQHMTELRRALDAEHRAANSPPVTTLPSNTTRTTPPTSPSPEPITPTAPPPSVVTPATAATVERAPAHHESITKRRWFWPVVAGGAALVIAGVTVGIVVGTSKTVPPTPTFGSARGN